MRALTVRPGTPNTAALCETNPPVDDEETVLVSTIAVGPLDQRGVLPFQPLLHRVATGLTTLATGSTRDRAFPQVPGSRLNPAAVPAPSEGVRG